MTIATAQRCPCCGDAKLSASCRPGRVLYYRNTVLALPADLRIPRCKHCLYEDLSLTALPAGMAEDLYRAGLRERAVSAIWALRLYRPMRRIELLLNLSQGYLSRLGAGDAVPGAALVSLLALLAAQPELIDWLDGYWTLPPQG